MQRTRSTFPIGSVVLVAALAVVVLALLAPTAVGRMMGNLWVSTMATVFGLIGGLFGG